MGQPPKRSRQDTPVPPTVPEQERLAATAAWAEQRRLLTIATTLRQLLAADRAER